MTFRRFSLYFWTIIGVLLLYAAVLAIVGRCYGIDKSIPYTITKDSGGVVIGFVTAWLAFIYSRRSAYVQSLRSYFEGLVPVIQSAIQYTHLKQPSQEQFSLVYASLAGKIDALRSVFENDHSDPRNEPTGLYPYENLKLILQALCSLGYRQPISDRKRADTRNIITSLWKQMHDHLVAEFDRAVPTKPLTADSQELKTLLNTLPPF